MHRRQEKERKRTDEDIVAGIEYRHRYVYVYKTLSDSGPCMQLHACPVHCKYTNHYEVVNHACIPGASIQITIKSCACIHSALQVSLNACIAYRIVAMHNHTHTNTCHVV
jgi:hypothetical protein